MKRPNCQIKGCKGFAMVAYGGRWVCGNCMVKVLNKQKERQEMELKELEDN